MFLLRKETVFLSHLSWFSSVQFSCPVVSDSLRLHEPQYARPPCPSPTPRVHPKPCPSSQWCHPTISSSVIPSWLVVAISLPTFKSQLQFIKVNAMNAAKSARFRALTTKAELVMPSNPLIFPLLLPPSIFPRISIYSNESGLCIDGQSIGASASAPVLPMHIQGWFSLGFVGL